MNLLGSSVYFFLLPLFVLSLGPQFHQVFISKLLVLYNKEFNEVDLLQILLQLVMKVTKLLKTSLDSSSTVSKPQKSWTNGRVNVLPNPTNGDSYNLMPSKVNVFMAL